MSGVARVSEGDDIEGERAWNENRTPLCEQSAPFYMPRSRSTLCPLDTGWSRGRFQVGPLLLTIERDFIVL